MNPKTGQRLKADLDTLKQHTVKFAVKRNVALSHSNDCITVLPKRLFGHMAARV